MVTGYSANSNTIDLGMSEVYKLYNNGVNNDPWWTPANMVLHPENAPSILTLKNLWAKKEPIIPIIYFIGSSLKINPVCHVES